MAGRKLTKEERDVIGKLVAASGISKSQTVKAFSKAAGESRRVASNLFYGVSAMSQREADALYTILDKDPSVQFLHDYEKKTEAPKASPTVTGIDTLTSATGEANAWNTIFNVTYSRCTELARSHYNGLDWEGKVKFLRELEDRVRDLTNPHPGSA